MGFQYGNVKTHKFQIIFVFFFFFICLCDYHYEMMIITNETEPNASTLHSGVAANTLETKKGLIFNFVIYEK
mgnify:CR=1 FL=1